MEAWSSAQGKAMPLREDAGCTDPDILAHCRGPGPHVRGCWVVDLLTGRE